MIPLPFDSQHPPEAAQMKYLYTIVLLLGGTPDFTSIMLYCENCCFVYPNRCNGLNIAVLPNITQLVKSARSFPDTCRKFTVHWSPLYLTALIVLWNNFLQNSDVFSSMTKMWDDQNSFKVTHWETGDKVWPDEDKPDRITRCLWIRNLNHRT